MIWIAARVATNTQHAQLVGVLSMVLAGNLITDDQPGLKRIQRQAYGWLQDPTENICHNLTVAQNAALHRGQEVGLEIVSEDENNSQIVFDERHQNHMFLFQTLRATSLLYVGNPEEGAEKALLGFQFIPLGFRPQVVIYMRNGLDMEDWFAEWVRKTAVGTG